MMYKMLSELSDSIIKDGDDEMRWKWKKFQRWCFMNKEFCVCFGNVNVKINMGEDIIVMLWANMEILRFWGESF